MKKVKLHRNCQKCDSRFLPTGRRQMICIKCYYDAHPNWKTKK